MPSDGAKKKNYVEIFRGEMQKNASMMWKAHWIVRKFQQLNKVDNETF